MFVWAGFWSISYLLGKLCASNSKDAHYLTANLAIKVPHLRFALAVYLDINSISVNSVWQYQVKFAQDVRIKIIALTDQLL